MSVLVQNFTREQIEIGLRWLDRALEQSEVLDSVVPINLLSYGGVLAVCLFGVRGATRDVDVLLPPNIRDVQAYSDEFMRLTNAIADELGYMRDWINDDLRLFVPPEDRQRLLEDSIEQGTAVFEGDNMVIWAGVWEFGLESKLRRMGDNGSNTDQGRARFDRDRMDAMELVHLIKGDSIQPLDMSWVKGLQRYPQTTGISDQMIQIVAQGYVAKFGTQGVVELTWDEAEEKHKYQNLAANWVWYESKN
ncbi:hypothetical protein M0657_001260 [Pyricularia oryzae]|uniref:Uncharacterized protein n=1 Tax=Pyricularia oryzae (strain Y34) TaxID=1143189 RepID=A0AA97PJN8_PYRO3|nr:hypothetical protein OOU_Y34scaffold00624g105 [Pyricularia oryzae Y34]KAI7923723.1 hypothetical protein M9X92_004172 [Pyricularia oryzae]KAI7931306.1 hypothetical protein M0657_001260 [Pyricularia oryzae]